MSTTADKRRQKRGESPLSHPGAPSPSPRGMDAPRRPPPPVGHAAGRVSITHMRPRQSGDERSDGRAVVSNEGTRVRGSRPSRSSSQRVASTSAHVEAEGLPCVGHELRATSLRGLPPVPGTPQVRTSADEVCLRDRARSHATRFTPSTQGPSSAAGARPGGKNVAVTRGVGVAALPLAPQGGRCPRPRRPSALLPRNSRL
jgi:hypothetical protein